MAHQILKYCAILLWSLTIATFVLGFIKSPIWFAATLPYLLLSLVPSAYLGIHRVMKRSMGG